MSFTLIPTLKYLYILWRIFRSTLDVPLEEAVRLAMKEVVGAYAIVVMDATNPTQLIAARKGSPLVIGVGEGEFFFASDATPLLNILMR
jgi:glucosamine 6-phosphate synthetase-like amidotransferase/phosphosugar isomerase protein